MAQAHGLYADLARLRDPPRIPRGTHRHRGRLQRRAARHRGFLPRPAPHSVVGGLSVLSRHGDQRRHHHRGPRHAYSENWEYAQFFVGSSLAKLAVAYLFIPAFYRYDCTTIYEFLRYRFG